MTDSAFDQGDILLAVIEDIDALLALAKEDLLQLNAIARAMRSFRNAGEISDLHYTVDQERLQRTISKCKVVLLTLIQHRQRAVDLLKE